jgi:hypothetical protein
VNTKELEEIYPLFRYWLQSATIEAKYQLFEEWLRAWSNEAPGKAIGEDDVKILVLVGRFLLGEELFSKWWGRVNTYFIEQNEERCRSNFDRLKKEGTIPAELTFEEYYSLLLSPPPETNFPPGHPFWKAHGVNNITEWKALHINGFTIDKYWPKAARTLINAYRNAFERQGFSDKMVYSEEVEPTFNPDLDPVDPAELLHRIGLNEEDTSPREWFQFMRLSQKILDGVLDPGSKKGLSLNVVFGSEAPKIRQTISRFRRRGRRLRK